MRVLVGHASAYGSTKGIARRIGAQLSNVTAGHGTVVVDIRPVDEIGDVNDYDAVVVGSAIHDGRWLPEALRFVERHANALAARPVWLFSVSSVGETTSFFDDRVARVMRRARAETDELRRLRSLTDAVEHRSFAGAIEREHWPAVGRAFFALFRGTYGDHRDWADIDTWSAGIGRMLATGMLRRTA